MKNALILHGTDATANHHWFPWLKKELESDGWNVWVPDLPQANKPNIQRYNTYLRSQKEFKNINNETVMIGHSAGAVAVLGLVQELPDDIVIQQVILVSALKDDLGWESLNELFEKPFDFEKIKKHVKQITLIHADNDPYIPLDQPEYLADQLGGELIIIEGQGHFNIESNPNFTTFPYLMELLKD